MRDIIQSFTQISSAEWLEILILLVVAAILGLIIGWLLRSFKVRSLKGLLVEKENQYNSLAKTHQEKIGFISEMEAENLEMTNRITVLNEEIKSLKLRLTNNQSNGILLEDETALIVTDEVELDETDTNTTEKSTGWLQRLRNTFSANQNAIATETGDEISFEEKLAASNTMIERLLSSNEKLEDENEGLKQKLQNLETSITDNKVIPTATVAAPVIVKKEVDAEKIDQYTNSLKDAKTTNKDLLKRIEELEIYNGKIIKQLETETEDKITTQQKLIESGDYKAKYLELAPKFETVEIDNSKLSAELSQLKSNAKSEILKTELKSKEDTLAKCINEKQALAIKLEDTSKALASCNDQQQALKTKLDAAINKTKLDDQISAKVVSVTPPPLPSNPIAFKKNKDVSKPAENISKPAENISKPDLETSHDIMNRIKTKANSIDFSRIGAGNVDAKDDLKKVKGIGEFVEKKLNALGIYHFKQLANLTEEDMDKVNDAIEFFPGRIKRDNWVAQAKKMAGEG